MIVMKLSGYSSGMTPREGYKDWFEVISVSLTVSGRARTKVAMEFRVFREQDAMSNVLFRLCAAGDPLRQVFVDFLNDSTLVSSFVFDDVLVTSMQIGAQGADRPTESVDFNAASFKASELAPAKP